MLKRAGHSELEGAVLLATDHAFEDVSSDEGGSDHVGDRASALLVLHALGSSLVLVEDSGDALHASHALGSSDDSLTVVSGRFVEVGSGNRDLLASHQDDLLEHVSEGLRLLFPESDVLDHSLVVSGHSVGSVLSSGMLGVSLGVLSFLGMSLGVLSMSLGVLGMSFSVLSVLGGLGMSLGGLSVLGVHSMSLGVLGMSLGVLGMSLGVLSVLGGLGVLSVLGMSLGVLVLVGLGMSLVGTDLVVVLLSGMVGVVVLLGDLSVSSGSVSVSLRLLSMFHGSSDVLMGGSKLTLLHEFLSGMSGLSGDLSVLFSKFLEVFSSSLVCLSGSVEFGGMLLGVDSFVSILTFVGVLLGSLDNSLGDVVASLSFVGDSLGLLVHTGLLHLVSKFL